MYIYIIYIYTHIFRNWPMTLQKNPMTHMTHRLGTTGLVQYSDSLLVIAWELFYRGYSNDILFVH